ncbi:MAG TPA: hypothetical protein VIM37_01630 [Candidatus Microsaccharimonas sp.]
MREQSPDDYIRTLERQFNRQKRIRSFLFDLAIGSAMMLSPAIAQMALEEIQKTDTLPHD